MADYGVFGRGIKVYPLQTPSTNISLLDADPFVFYALEFFTSVITTYVGARFLAAAATAPEITSVVAMTVPFDPVPVLLSTHFKFPLLAVYRKNGDLEERTIGHRHDVSSFDACYILPPLEASLIEQLAPLMMGVRDVLDDRTWLGFDPNYTPTNGTLGQPFWTDIAGVEKVFFRKYESGVIANLDDTLAFYAIRMTGEVRERAENSDSNFGPLTGFDMSEFVEELDVIDVSVSDLNLDAITTEAGYDADYVPGANFLNTENGEPIVTES